MTVLFNASVVLAGLCSQNGGSGKILNWARQGKITGIISEIVLDEILRHSQKTGLSQKKARNLLKKTNLQIVPPPKKLTRKYQDIVTDPGDMHLFESANKEKANYLVSLDKKHVLALKKKVTNYQIVSPGDLIRQISQPTPVAPHSKPT